MISAKSLCNLLWGCLLLLTAGCTGGTTPSTPAEAPPEKLSAYGLFLGNGSTQQPVWGVVPYDLNTPLFSDYATKYRFIRLPPNAQAVYSDSDVFDFPVGTIIAKTFAYPADMRDPSKGRRLLETRILKHEPSGWVGLPYIWNAEQTEATLELAGGTVDVSWIHTDGKPRTNNYLIPNANQCKECHRTQGPMEPIGPKARQLNREFTYSDGTENQLAHWTRLGILAGAPKDLSAAPRLAVWNDPATGNVDQRARAWLEINCAHCHNPAGPARNSGLDLRSAPTTPVHYGVFKSPVAAGHGSGGRQYDIVPGKPDDSILAFRIASTTPQIMMPELGKRMVHDEGVALIRQWIADMPSPATGDAAKKTR